MITDQILDTICARVANGEGVESILKDLSIPSNEGTDELKAHPRGRGSIEDAKTKQEVWFEQNPDWLTKVDKTKLPTELKPVEPIEVKPIETDNGSKEIQDSPN